MQQQRQRWVGLCRGGGGDAGGSPPPPPDPGSGLPSVDASAVAAADPGQGMGDA